MAPMRFESRSTEICCILDCSLGDRSRHLKVASGIASFADGGRHSPPAKMDIISIPPRNCGAMHDGNATAKLLRSWILCRLLRHDDGAMLLKSDIRAIFFGPSKNDRVDTRVTDNARCSSGCNSATSEENAVA